MTSAILQLPCLGRPFHIGSLYNCYYEKLVPGNNIWENRIIQSKKQVSNDYEIITQDSLESKFHSLGVSDSLKLSFLAGMIEVSSSAEYLTDRVSSKDQARVTLKYITTTHMEEVEAEELSSIQNPDASISEAATHVVTGILYGSEVFFIFDRSINPTENMCDISGCLENLVRCIPKLKSCKTSEEEIQKVHCMCYGNLSLCNPLSYKDAAEVCSKLPTLLEDKSVPVVAFLHPLPCGKPAGAPVCSTLISRIEEIMELLHDAEIQCKDLKKNEHCPKFTDFNNELSSFLTLLNRFKAKSMKKLSELVPKIRQSTSKEVELNNEIASINQSPFNAKEIDIYLKHKAKELKFLCHYINNLCKDPVVHFISSTNDLSELTTDLQYEFVICFSLNVTAKESNYLQKIEKHMKSTSNPILNYQCEWFESQQILKDLRHKIKQFLDFLKLNKQQENLAFVVMDKNEEIESITNPVILLYSSGVPEYFEPPSRPGNPMVDSVTDNSISLYWSSPEEGADSVLSYNVYYCASAQSKDAVHWKKISTQYTAEKIQIKGLSQNTDYTVSVEAVCSAGISNRSKESQARTTPLFLARPADDAVKISELIKDGTPMIYQLPLKPTFKDTHNHLCKMEVGSYDRSTRKPEKVLMMVGATGAGKSTLINALANYVLGIQWEDTFRFKVITGEDDLSQAHSQTKYITAYTLHQTTQPYSLTIVDTPGFGDTRGIENDKRIARQIKTFFSNDQSKGVDHLNGIGFVTQASLPRLTPTQRYIFDAVLSIFGKDIVDNIFLMTTFADADDPPVLEAVRVAKIPHKQSFKFNNSAIFAWNDASEQFNHIFWEMGNHSLSSFFDYFSISDPQSLKLTKEVLIERERLEALIPGLEMQVKIGLSRLDEIQQEERILQQHEAEINANKNFKYTIKVNKHRKVPLTGVYTTNCLKCSFTCHDHCIYANDEDKIKCCAMKSGICKVCPGKCHWTNHSNTPYYFEYYDEYENRTYDDLKKRYETAQSGKNKTQSMISASEEILKEVQGEVYALLNQIRFSIQRLDDIALRPNPLSDIEYIDLLVDAEKREHQKGWEERVRQYEQIRKDAEVLRKIPKVDAAATEHKTWWKRWWHSSVSTTAV